MRSTLDDAIKQLTELRSLIGSIVPVNKALSGHEDTAIRKYLIVRRRFDYAAFVVALYATMERFTEDLVAAYSGLMSQRMAYGDLPAKLQQKHMSRSAELLLRGRLGEGRYATLRPVEVISNLYSCLTNAASYELNDDAITAHDLNLRRDELNALFSSVGIDQICDVIRQADGMVRWYSASQGDLESSQSVVPSAVIEQRINDIVERRNQVAHRGGGPLELLGPEEMTDAIDFVEALLNATYSVVVARYLKHGIGAGEADALKAVEGPYKNGYVVVVKRPEKPLFITQPAFTLTSGGARWGYIESLQLNDSPVDRVDEDSVGKEVGIQVNFQCRPDSILYVLEERDDAVWGEYLSQHAQGA